MTAERLEEIRARHEAATPGPWRYDFSVNGGPVVSCQDLEPIGYHPKTLRNWFNPRFKKRLLFIPLQGRINGKLIAHARSDIPALLAEVERLKAENQELELDVQELHYLDDEASEMTAENERLKKELEKFKGFKRRWIMQTKISHMLKLDLAAIKQSMLQLMKDSDGVAGLHLNGELAEWDWLIENEWLAWMRDQPASEGSQK